MNQPLTYETHRRIVPAYHVFIIGILSINVLVELWQVITAITGGTDVLGALWEFLVAAALVLLALYTRMFPIRVQDRVIQLEQRLRLVRVLPPELHPNVHALAMKHLIGIRFASDNEVPELVEFCIAHPNASTDDVKKRIKLWIADPHRI